MNTFRIAAARFGSIKPPAPATGEVWEDATRKRLGFYDGADHRYTAWISNDDLTFAYTVGGDVDTITLASGGVKTFSYDVDGNVETITNTDTGITTDLTYTLSGDVDTITYTDTL